MPLAPANDEEYVFAATHYSSAELPAEPHELDSDDDSGHGDVDDDEFDVDLPM